MLIRSRSLASRNGAGIATDVILPLRVHIHTNVADRLQHRAMRSHMHLPYSWGLMHSRDMRLMHAVRNA